MRKSVLIIAVAVLLGSIQGKTVDEIKRENAERIQMIKKQGEINQAAIKQKYNSFLLEIKKLAPGTNLAMPLPEANARNVIEHDSPPDQMEFPVVNGWFTADYTLKSAAGEAAGSTGYRVSKGEKVEVVLYLRTRSMDSWCLVRLTDGREGFAPDSVLANAVPGTKTNLKTEVWFVNSSSGLNMRRLPDASSEKITLIPDRARVELLQMTDKSDTFGGKTGNWAEVRYEGQTGYVFAPFLVRKLETTTVVAGSGKFIMPVAGRVSSGFGGRIDPVTKKTNSFHKGLDIIAKRGTPIQAAGNGTIARAETVTGYGKLIVISHGGDLYTYYAHQDKFKKSRGDTVKQGEVIGVVGMTGKTTGPHLHFEVRKGSDADNPIKYLPH